MDPVSELLAQPFRLEKTTAPTLSDVAVERMNTVREYAQSEKLPYMTYDQVMSKASDVYSPSDFSTVGQRIRDNVVKAIETRFPVIGEKYTLRVENVHYEKPKQTAIKEEKEVILKDGSLNDRLKGTWVLYDNATGKEVSRKNATLLNVPRMTSRGTFIRNGSEIGLKHMFRLRSGVYTHIKNNGRVSAHINPEQTTGQQMSIEMEPSTGVFSISRGTRTYGLLPILKAAGVPDDVVKGYMGEELYKANYEKYGKLMGSDSQMEEYRKVWTESMAPIKLDAETTESTLGKGFSKMDPDVLLRASGRILQVSRTMSDNDTDDRDSLRYQRVMGPADYIPERIVRDGGGLLRKLFNTVTKSGNLDAVVTGAFQPHVDSVFLDDKHAGYIDGSSPMEALDFANMISRIGEGGIGSLRAAPAETRGVNDSYLGFIDPVRCYSRNHQIMTVSGWKNIADVTMHDRVACLINGAVEYHSPDAVHAYDYNQDLYCYVSKAVAYEVTGNHRMWVCKVAHKGGQKKRGGYQKEYKPSFMFETAEDMHNTNRRVMTGGHAPYTGCWESRGTADDFNYEDYGISQVDWATFMGWYLSEGSTLIKNDKGQADRNCTVSISQTKAVHPKDYEDICQLLARLPWSFKASKQERALCIKSRELAQYLRRFGYCNDKYIPAQIFDMSVEARKAFMDAMMRGDGRQPQGNEGWVYTTTSEKLASGVERMLFDLGHCVTTHMYEDKRTDWYLPVYEVRATVSKQGWLIKNGREVTEREERSDYYKRKPCDGKVFCVTVPGGMVYTRIQGHKGFWCGNSPESLKVGLDIYLTHGIMKDSSGKLYNRFKDKKGTPIVVPMDVTSKSIVATPEFYDPKGDPNEFIPAMYQGKGIEYVKRKDVDFYVDNSNTMMSVGSGMIPLIGGIRSNRTLMGCLHPDTLVTVIRSNGQVENICACELLGGADNIKLLSVDESGNYFTVAIRGVHRVDSKPCWKVTTDHGDSVTVSTDHKWWTFRNRSSEPEITNELTVGDFLPFTTTSGIISTLGEAFNVLVPVDSTERRHKTDVDYILVDRDVAWLLGLYLAEGSVSHYKSRAGHRRPYGVDIACVQDDIRERVVDILTDRFNGNFTISRDSRYPDGYGVRLNNAQLARWFQRHFMEGCRNKKVPSFMFTAPADIKMSFIMGYLDGDGTVVKHRSKVKVGFTTISANIQTDLCLLLTACGIETYRRVRCNKHGKVFSAILSNKNISKLQNFTHPDKQARMDGASLTYVRNYSRDPYTAEMLSACVNKFGGRSAESKRVRSGSCSNSYYDSIGLEAPDFLKKVRWDRITSIEPVEPPAYLVDIDVDDNVYMLANGMFTHNSKYANQAVALQEPEAPLVQRKMVDKDGNETTTEKFISRQLGAKYAPVAGKVLKVDADSIVIAGRDGQKHTIDLYNEYPANQKGFIHNTALVKPGDTVAPNQLLAKSNYTDDEGTAALGKNLNVAYMTGRNAGTFEDSITISESAAKKMSSTQLYKLRGDTSDDIEYSKQRYLSLFKDDFTPEQLDKIDENGLPKPGVVFQQGDPVYLGVQTRDIGVHGLAKNAAVPYVTRWEHSAPGTVTNVVQGKKHLTVYTKAVTPMEIGDKLCFDDQTEILTDKGWKLFKDLDDTERVLTMDLQTCDTWMTAYSDRYSYKYKGKMYSLKTKYLDICTTPDHEHLVSVSNHNQYVIKLNSKKVIGKKYFHIVGQDVCNPHNYKPSQTDETEESWVDYDGRVYCVTVPYTHTVFVRRNGKTVWSGNSSRYGNKGTVGEILPDEEMPKDSNGNTFDVLLSPLGIPSRCYDKDTEFLVQGKGWLKGSEVLETDLLYCFDPVTMTGRFDKQLEPMYKKLYKGIMFGYQNRCTDFLVTPGHKVYARTDYKGSQYKETIIDDVYNKRYIFPSVCRMASWAENAEPFYLPTIDINKRDGYTTDDAIIYDAHDWAAFLGWYLSEGNTTYVNYGHREDGSVVSPDYRVHIAQDAEVHPEKAAIIDKLLTRMGFTYSYGEHNKQFHISGKRLAHYLKQFGNCYEKYIPDWLFKQPESVIDAFLDAIWLGDGTHHLDTQSKRGLYKPGTQTFVKSITLASEKLIDQIQILFSMKGIKTVKTVVPPDKRHKGAHTLYHLGVSTRDAGVSCTRDRKGQSLHPQWYTKEYDDMVYCPTVPTGYVLTRRNGRVICLGNTNTSVLAELTLSKIAAERGVKYVLPDFLDESIIDYVDRELKKHGIEPDEDVYDPVTGKTVPKIQTGKMFFYKLKHMAELKERGRSTGTYSAEDIPLKGEGAARRLGGMESSAVFSGGGMEVLRDAKIVRGQRNDEFWRDYRSGKYPETPGFPLVHQKFFAHLKAAGVNLEDKGDRVHLYGATDANMKELTGNRQVTKAATFESKNMQPIAGGLFDPTIFGADGDQWGYVDLPEPVLNPIMFKTVGSVLGWKDKELTEYLEGSRELNGKFGTQNLIDTLNNIDLPKELAKAKQVLKSDSTTLEQRDMARKRIRAIEPMIREGKKPSDFFFTRMPILPPRFRPVTAMSNGVGIAADANFLYKRMMDAAEDLREAKEVLPEEMQLDARKQLYSTVNAVTGLTPTDDPKLEAKGVAGVLKWAFGKGSPKCYDPETEILTERGWIKFPEYVDMQDYDLPVMTFNPHNDSFEWQKPQRVISKKYKGVLVHTVNDDVDTCVTSDHMHYLCKRSNNPTGWGTWGKVEASKLLNTGEYYMGLTVYVSRDRELDVDAILNEDIDIRYFKDVYRCAATRMVTIDCDDSRAVDYNGLVYCVTVPNGLIVTRRNGKPIVSGNCGSLHRKVFGANLDLGSLGTITPDNSLTIDQVGIPERSAWKMFEPFVVRKLVQQGASVVDAMKGVLDQTDEARRALIDVMKERPILINRAPTLWRYGIQGQYPVLVDGNAIRVNPNICKVFNADFDGNCLDFDSKIFVKLSQSALDFFERAVYINSNANQEGKKEENMSVARESLFGLSLSEGVYLMSIGKFPKVGEPFKDKNGADVYGLPSGIEVLSADPVTGEHKFCKVTSFTEEKDCECVEVTIDSRKVVVSSNATMAVFDHETGKLVKVPASEHNDRLVPVFKQCPVAFGDKYDRDFGWWLGALISDGWITDRTVGYTKVEDNKRAEFIRIARTIHENFVANEYRSEKSDKKLAESVKVHLNGTDLAKKCMEFGIYADDSGESITGRAALRKQIPYAMIHNGSEEFLYGLLSGLLDGDGSISKNTSTKNVRFSCRLSTSSPYLRETFEILLYRLGLRWSTTVTPPRGWSKESYNICPSTVDMCSILDKLSCIGEKETALIKEWKDNISTKDDKDIVPISRAELDSLKKNKLHTINTSLYVALSSKHASTRALAMKYVDFLKQHAPEFVSRLYMTNTLWRPISSVEDAGKRDVYDFAVPDTKVFAANTGIVIYDSMTTHVPVSKEAVKAIDEKMLPSRNLLSPIDMKAHFVPVAEFTQGLYLASRTRNEAPIRFKTKEDMMAALNRGEIQIDTPVVIG